MYADKKILVIGAGVIGSIYAVKIMQTGCEVTVLEKGKRYNQLLNEGIKIKNIRSNVEKSVKVKVIDSLSENDYYDYILVAVRNENLKELYPILKKNCSSNLVFMTNNYLGTQAYINELGRSRTIIAFPGVAGKLDKGIVKYRKLSRFIQPTTIGDLSEQNSERIKTLKDILCKAGFCVKINKDMNSLLLNHLALGCPLACAIYFDGGNNYSVASNEKAMIVLTEAIKENFEFIANESDLKINPVIFRFFLKCPDEILFFILRWIYKTKWAELVINDFALKTREEIEILSWGFLKTAFNRGKKLDYLERLLILS